MTQYGNTVLAELPQESVIKVLCGHLMKLAKMYQLKDFDTENAVLLAHWITQNYRYEQLSIITGCLSNPPKVEKVWRLTPDTVSGWIEASLDRAASKREIEIHNEKFKEEPEGDPDPRLAEWLKELEIKEAIRPITEEEIKYEGGEKPAKPKYVPPGREYYVMAQLKAKYGRECCDLHTGKVKPGMPSFDEWLMTQK